MKRGCSREGRTSLSLRGRVRVAGGGEAGRRPELWVAFDAYYFKLWHYESRQAKDKSDPDKKQWQRAPMLLGRTFEVIPDDGRGESTLHADDVDSAWSAGWRPSVAWPWQSAFGSARGTGRIGVTARERIHQSVTFETTPDRMVRRIRLPNEGFAVAAETEMDDPKPTKGAPVIRQVEVAAGRHRVRRVLNRHVPAWVISGAIHVVVIGFLVIFMSGPVPDGGQHERPGHHSGRRPEGRRQEPDERRRRVRPGPGGRHRRQARRERQRRSPGHERRRSACPISRTRPPRRRPIAGLTQDLGAGAPADLEPERHGDAGDRRAAASAFSVPGMAGRSGATKDKLLKAGGGNSESEAAVARGLAWLARKQLKDGSWEFDGSSKDKIAATGMALLPFLAAGETHKFGTKYKKTVENGLELADEPDRLRRRRSTARTTCTPTPSPPWPCAKRPA